MDSKNNYMCMPFTGDVINHLKDFIISVQESDGNIEEVIEQLDTKDFQDKLNIFIKSKIPKTKSSKSKRDPTKPKRARSAYIYFCTFKRAELKDENPNLPPKEITKLLGSSWKSLEDDDKVQYNKMAAEDKIRNKDEMVEYSPIESDSDSGNKKTKKQKKQKKVSGPKHPKSAYIFFCQDNRAEMKETIKKESPDLDAKTINQEILKALGISWNKLSEKHRLKYNTQALEDKTRYQTEKEKWVDPDSDEEKSDDKPKKEKKQTSKKKPAPKKKPVKKPLKPVEIESDLDEDSE
jgi:hypothetical protein